MAGDFAILPVGITDLWGLDCNSISIVFKPGKRERTSAASLRHSLIALDGLRILRRRIG